MDAQASLSELVRLSTQVVEAVIAGAAGVDAATVSDERAALLAQTGADLLAAAADVRPGIDVERVAVDLPGGAVVVVRTGDRSVVATTVSAPSIALLTYDLRSTLSRLSEPTARTQKKRSGA